jgi:hypothetical protein
MNSIIGYALAGVIFGAGSLFLFRLAETVTSAPRMFGGAIDRVFGTDAFSLRFIGAALLLSIFSFLLFFATYLFKLPAFADSLMDDAYQRHAVARQLFEMFLPVNAVIAYLSLAYSRDVALQMERAGETGQLPVFLAKDLLMKVVIVALAMGLVYLVLTPSGSFRSPQAALMAVPGVFWGALQFGNLNCVYIYSSLVSSVWLWATLLSRLWARRRLVPSPAMTSAGIAALFYWVTLGIT